MSEELNALVRSRVAPNDQGVIQPFVDLMLGEDVITLEPTPAVEIGKRLISAGSQAIDLWAFISVLKHRGMEDEEIGEVLKQAGNAASALNQKPGSGLEVVTDPKMISKLGGKNGGR